jgi:myo-inositol-1(or 4)-monophosphatase
MAGSPLLNVMKLAVQKAGRALARDFGEIENIQGNRAKLDAFIGHAKENAQGVLLDELEKAREGFGYLSSTKTKDSKLEERWLVNIIDGEENYIRGIPHWSISLALEDKEGLVAGVVYDVVRDEIYYAQKGFGAFVNHRRLKVGDVNALDGAVVFSSFNASSCGAPMTRIGQGKALYGKCVTAIRSMGSLALDICYVAGNKGELAFSNVTHPYEIAAAALIAKEAGVFVSNLKGGKDFVYEGTILASLPSIQRDAIKLLNA